VGPVSYKYRSYSKLENLPTSKPQKILSASLAQHLRSPYNQTVNSFKGILTKGNLTKAVLLIFTAVITFLWLDFAPDGLLGKMDAVGYAVCHRIDARSFHLGERAIPLCARCSGMQLGTLLGLAYQAIWGRKGKFPPKKILIVLSVFAFFFVVDGVNSYLNFIPMLPSVYASSNWLRLVTGTGLGLGLAAIIFPIFNQTIWKDWEYSSALENWKVFLGLIGLAILLDIAILSENPLVLYPLAILSGLAVLVVLSLCYTLLLVMAFKKDNQFLTWKSVWVFLTAGFGVAITQTFLIDLLRFFFTGTWNGFNL
jgi:uncharacterized membrane protein